MAKFLEDRKQKIVHDNAGNNEKKNLTIIHSLN